MDKRDYIAFAEMFQNHQRRLNTGTGPTVALSFHLLAVAKYFKEDNEAFDKERFLAACKTK